MTALDPADRPTAAEVAAMLAVGSARRGRRGAHRRSPARSPRLAGAATAVAVAVAVTTAALPSVERPAAPAAPREMVLPEVRRGAVVPLPAASSRVPSAVVPVDVVAATLSEGRDAARRRADAVAKTLNVRSVPIRVNPPERPGRRAGADRLGE